MGFLHLSLTLGGFAIGIPILLHLALRQKPRQLVFPAVRFVKQRRETNVRRLQLRHWLLLALRCVAFLLLAALLARPRASSAVFGNWVLIAVLAALAILSAVLALGAALQKRGRLMLALLAAASLLFVTMASGMLVSTLRQDKSLVLGDQAAPVAAILIFDTSPRMEYRFQNQTRLEQAQAMANWLIKQFPPDSQFAILESRPIVGAASDARDEEDQVRQRAAGFARDRAAGQKLVDRLETTGAPRPLPELIRDALQLAATSELGQREVYLFTDMTEAAWQHDSAGKLSTLVSQADRTSLYVIDVGATDPQNTSLGGLKLSSQSLARNSRLEIEATVDRVGPGTSCAVELLVEEPSADLPILRDGKPVLPTAVPRGQQFCDLPAGGSQLVRFSLNGLPLGVHHGSMRITSPDNLTVDDQRYFTVSVQRSWPVLVVAPSDVNTRLLTEVLAPGSSQESAEDESWEYRCEVVAQSDLASQDLGRVAAVVFLDPLPLTPDDWRRIEAYVRSGGSVAFFLGHHAHPFSSFNESAAQQVLPGKLARQTRAGGWDLFLVPSRLDHPALASFRPIPRESVPWHRFPVMRHWDLEELGQDAEVVLRYGNQKPALVVHELGEGRVATMTTPITEVDRPRGWESWNELAGEDAWPRFYLLNDLMLYLVSRRGSTRLNVQTGEVVALPNDSRQPQRYQLYGPGSQPQDVNAQETSVVVRLTDRPGNYRLKGNVPRGSHATGPTAAAMEDRLRGFSANLPPEASRLERLAAERLDGILGADRYQLARSRDEIEFGVRETRVGREFYPFLLVMLAIVAGVEHAFSNRFYPTRT